MSEKQETTADIIAAERREADSIEASARGLFKAGEDWDERPFTESDLESALDLAETKRKEADRLEAAHRRETDSIHRAMVILAGIEMPNPDYPPRLGTALEDAYNALSDALGTDGDTTADEEEAKSTGRHFVIHPSGDAAKLREALKTVKRYFDGYTVNVPELRRQVDAALAAPPRNCDRLASAEEAWDAYDEWVESCRAKGQTPAFNEFGWLFAPATEEEGGAE